MSVRPLVMHALVVTVGLSALVPAAVHASRARAAADKQLASLTSTLSRARQVRDLRDKTAEWASRSRPGSGLTERVTSAMGAAGLPATCLGSLSAEAEQSVAKDGEVEARRQRAVITLGGGPVTLPALGKFLARWREREPGWTVAALDLAPESGQGAAKVAQTGGDLPLRAVITLEAVFLNTPIGENAARPAAIADTPVKAVSAEPAAEPSTTPKQSTPTTRPGTTSPASSQKSTPAASPTRPGRTRPPTPNGPNR